MQVNIFTKSDDGETDLFAEISPRMAYIQIQDSKRGFGLQIDRDELNHWCRAVINALDDTERLDAA